MRVCAFFRAQPRLSMSTKKGEHAVSNEQTIGHVAALWRYPVKSMQGEELNAAEVTERGLLGDRAYALIDVAEGRVVSAKNPKKWPNMFRFRAAFSRPPTPADPKPPVNLTLPDGTIVTSNQPNVNRILSAALGREVKLQREPLPEPQLEEYWPDIEGLDHRDEVTAEPMLQQTFFDGATIHILSTATLDRLRAAYPAGRFEVRRFRPNIVIRTADGEPALVENDWLGCTFAIGNQVRIAIERGCPRCVMTTLAQYDLPADPGILRTAVKENAGSVGVYCRVVQSGTIHCDDPIRLEA